MIKLRAFSDLDGNCIIEENGNLYLLMAPYLHSSLKEKIENYELNIAIDRYGFTEITLEFNNYKELINWLDSKLSKRRGYNESYKEVTKADINDYYLSIAPELIESTISNISNGLCEKNHIQSKYILNTIIENDNYSEVREEYEEILKTALKKIEDFTKENYNRFGFVNVILSHDIIMNFNPIGQMKQQDSPIPC